MSEGADDRITLYIDVDGVLLGKFGFDGDEWFQLRPNAILFLMKCVERFNCMWLTAWRHDDLKALLKALYASGIAEKIGYASNWGSHKIDAVDLTRPFLWIEDGIGERDRQALAAAGRLDCYYEVPSDGEHALEDVWTWLLKMESRIRAFA